MSSQKPNEFDAHAALAFLIVECNVPLPYEVAENLSVKDPLYTALVNTWLNRRERDDYRTALLCMVINNTQGGKSKVSDFMPKKVLSDKEQEAEMLNNIKSYNAQSLSQT